MTLHFTIPGVTKSAANLREGHFARAKRAKAARHRAMLLCPKWTDSPILVVVLWRYGVRELDSDNLQAALKPTRDGVAARLKVDDGSPLVRWDYGQDRCAPGEERVEVAIGRPGRPQPPPGIVEGRTWTPTPRQVANAEATARALPTAATYRGKP